MQFSIKTMMFLVILSNLAACGGGDDSGTVNTDLSSAFEATSVSTETIVENTEDIIAERDFSFDVGEIISFSVNDQNVGDGALHLYTELAFTAENGRVIPNPVSRITTIYPSQTSEVELEVNTNWQQLYAEWVPMNATEEEKNWVIDLNQSNHNYHLDL